MRQSADSSSSGSAGSRRARACWSFSRPAHQLRGIGRGSPREDVGERVRLRFLGRGDALADRVPLDRRRAAGRADVAGARLLRGGGARGARFRRLGPGGICLGLAGGGVFHGAFRAFVAGGRPQGKNVNYAPVARPAHEPSRATNCRARRVAGNACPATSVQGPGAASACSCAANASGMTTPSRAAASASVQRRAPGSRTPSSSSIACTSVSTRSRKTLAAGQRLGIDDEECLPQPRPVAFVDEERAGLEADGRAGQRGDHDLDDQRQHRALVAAHRQHRSGEPALRIGGRVAVGVERPAGGNARPSLAATISLPRATSDSDRSTLTEAPSRRGNAAAIGLVPNSGRRPARRRHRRRRVAEGEADHPGRGDRLEVIRGDAEVVAVGDRGEGDAELARRAGSPRRPPARRRGTRGRSGRRPAPRRRARGRSPGAPCRRRARWRGAPRTAAPARRRATPGPGRRRRPARAQSLPPSRARRRPLERVHGERRQFRQAATGHRVTPSARGPAGRRRAPTAGARSPHHDVQGCRANSRASSPNALNSSALPNGSRKNIVACSPGSPLKRT